MALSEFLWFIPVLVIGSLLGLVVFTLIMIAIGFVVDVLPALAWELGEGLIELMDRFVGWVATRKEC